MVLKSYVDIKDAPLSDLLIQANINIDNQLIAFSDYSCLDCPYIDIITGAYIIFYQGGPIDYGTYVSGTVAQSSTESEYNVACTARMDLKHFRILIYELLNNDLDIVPEEYPLVILYCKSSVCMAKNDKYINHTRHISRRVHFVRNGENAKCTRLTGVKEVCNFRKF